ncbi:ubiquitin hydrolase B-like [Melanotaenia boesemani]|uniref:ubiquitin hydrolase B-like n=1 Tax=Melanotaenia boesemani TaxID=1250792 RepID=UPI001C059EC5|nr:ubiquitin hydrolase B-like [Melanotaenia boesemani]
MLEKYLLEVELEYSCECGGKSSGQTLTFASLPKTFIIHLKRFCYTPSFNLQKIYDPVQIQRDIVVSSKMGGGCFSLVSAISHSGSIEEGHYICDSIDPEDCPLEPTDHWLTFNDSMVLKTSGWDVCKKRQELAYILFYRRHVRKRYHVLNCEKERCLVVRSRQENGQREGNGMKKDSSPNSDLVELQ